MISDDIYQTIAAGYRKKSRQEARETVLSVATILAIVMLLTGGFVVMAVCGRSGKVEMTWEQMARDMALLGGGATLIWSSLACVIVRKLLKDIKKREREKLRRLEEHPEESYHIDELFENGFYESALKGCDDNLAKWLEESRKRKEELGRFFEECGHLEPWIDEIPRPVPEFKNIDLWLYGYYHEIRKRCFEKLGRTPETELEVEKMAALKKIVEENNKLTEKYWKDYYDD